MMNTLKQEALTAISHRPETADIGAIMYQLYVIEKVRTGRAAVEKGETIDADANYLDDAMNIVMPGVKKLPLQLFLDWSYMV